MSGTEKFDQTLKEYYAADEGAFSVVTETEAKDGQVTVSSDEKDIVVAHFGAEELAQYVGNDQVLEERGLDARREFRLFPTGEIVRPKLKYPKPDNSELRLYFNNDEFKVRKGHFWGVFRRDGDIWIFQSLGPQLARIKTGELEDGDRYKIFEDESDDYQTVINSKPPAQIQSTQKKWARDPSVAAKAIEKAGYVCELYPDFPTFVSRSTGNPFVEAHHLIPMKLQGDFEEPLDVEDNICALSPFAHRKIHLARFEDIIEDINKLAASREALLERIGISNDELLGYYSS